MLYTSPVIIRTGIIDVNWSNTTNTNFWGLPHTVKQPTINRLNKIINDEGGIIVMFLTPKHKVEGRLIAMCIVTDPIRLIDDQDPTDEAMNWISHGSNTLGIDAHHIFLWRLKIRDILFLEQSADISRTALIAHNGVDVNGNPKNLTRQSVHLPRGELKQYLLALYIRRWGL